jgi:hypothetical protein
MAREAPIEPAALLLLPPTALLAYGVAPALAGAAVRAAEEGRPFAVDRRFLAVASREGALRALAHATSLWPGDPDPRRRGVGAGRPILVLAAPPITRPLLGFLTTYLRRRSEWVWPVVLRAGTLDSAGRQVAGRVEALRRHARTDTVDIVAHGPAGVAVAWYLTHLGGAPHVGRLVSLGVPWAGTRMAVFQRGDFAATLLPGAPLLDGLAPAPVPHMAVVGTEDPAVVPRASALPAGAEPVVLDGVGHVDLLGSVAAFRAVAAALATPAPPPASAAPADDPAADDVAAAVAAEADPPTEPTAAE